MKRADIPIVRLLPLETRFGCDVEYASSMVPALKKLPPIYVVSFEREFIVADGHHRVIAHILGGQERVPARILEEDKELYRFRMGILAQYKDLASLRSAYRHIYKPRREEEAIETFRDYLWSPINPE